MIRVAHGAVLPGGPSAWLMALAALLFAVAVYSFATKASPRTFLPLLLSAIAIAIGSVAAPDDVHDARIAIEAPVDGSTVPAGEKIQVRIAVSGSRSPASPAASAPGVGHLHVLVDGSVVSMSSGVNTSVTLTPGSHTIEAELVAPDHRPLSPRVVARATVTAR